MAELGERYYTIRQAANKLSVNPRTINRWIHKGKLEAVKLPGRAGGEFRISATEVDHLLGEPSTDEIESVRIERNRLRDVLQEVWDDTARAIYVAGKGYELYLTPELRDKIKHVLSK